uniref:Uncharacterized protein n=1 Tax=Arundo donax TaxID=35708 RepID=A0A0A9F876_ARUDO
MNRYWTRLMRKYFDVGVTDLLLVPGAQAERGGSVIHVPSGTMSILFDLALKLRNSADI